MKPSSCRRLSLVSGLGVSTIVHGGIGGRHGDRTVEWSALLPGFDEPIGLIFIDTPHVEMHSDGIIHRALPRGFRWVTVGLNADIHPLQGDLLFLGQALHHVDGTSRDPRQKQFAGTHLLAAGIIRDEVMRPGVTDGAAQGTCTVASHFVCQREIPHRSLPSGIGIEYNLY